ncbi:MAG: hypothetical protein LBU45_00030, partial [Azoarcus sp.]|nr:hypothetical protein [Azoarcus sp.]
RGLNNPVSRISHSFRHRTGVCFSIVFPVSTKNATMLLTRSLVFARRVCAVLLLVAAGLQAAYAGDAAAENEQLAALVRQLDLIDRLAVSVQRTALRRHPR